jgi:hypothetical protein
VNFTHRFYIEANTAQCQDCSWTYNLEFENGLNHVVRECDEHYINKHCTVIPKQILVSYIRLQKNAKIEVEAGESRRGLIDSYEKLISEIQKYTWNLEEELK